MSRTTASLGESETTKQVRKLDFFRLAIDTAKQTRHSYQSQARSITFQRLKAIWTPNLSQPLFIIGSPRSGTTFLGSCIAELPEISYHFEPVASKAAARCVHEEIWDIDKAKNFYRMVYSWLMRLHLDADLRFAEKTPRNCFLIDFLHQTFPEAQFIHIIRDGRDAALSHSKKPWLQAASAQSGKRESSGYLYGPYPRFWVEQERRQEFQYTSDIHRCIWAWRRHTESILAQSKVLPVEQYYDLRYESLVNNPDKEAERLLNYLGVDQCESRDRFRHALGRAHPNSVGGWQSELSLEQVEQVEQEAGQLLRQLNYLK